MVKASVTRGGVNRIKRNWVGVMAVAVLGVSAIGAGAVVAIEGTGEPVAAESSSAVQRGGRSIGENPAQTSERYEEPREEETARASAWPTTTGVAKATPVGSDLATKAERTAAPAKVKQTTNQTATNQKATKQKATKQAVEPRKSKPNAATKPAKSQEESSTETGIDFDETAYADGYNAAYVVGQSEGYQFGLGGFRFAFDGNVPLSASAEYKKGYGEGYEVGFEDGESDGIADRIFQYGFDEGFQEGNAAGSLAAFNGEDRDFRIPSYRFDDPNETKGYEQGYGEGFLEGYEAELARQEIYEPHGEEYNEGFESGYLDTNSKDDSSERIGRVPADGVGEWLEDDESGYEYLDGDGRAWKSDEAGWVSDDGKIFVEEVDEGYWSIDGDFYEYH